MAGPVTLEESKSMLAPGAVVPGGTGLSGGLEDALPGGLSGGLSGGLASGLSGGLSGGPARAAAARGGAADALAPALGGERHIARVLRVGAVASGGMFLASVALQLLPESEAASTAVDWLRKGGASLLLVTPVARLVVAGGLLGARGEWRYTLYSAGVLALLGLAIGAGLAA
jgi:hypothetical protein